LLIVSLLPTELLGLLSEGAVDKLYEASKLNFTCSTLSFGQAVACTYPLIFKIQFSGVKIHVHLARGVDNWYASVM
jgi:hypothetical protein